MALARTVAVALVLAGTAWGTRDQYEAREATDRPPGGHMAHRAFHLAEKPKTPEPQIRHFVQDKPPNAKTPRKTRVRRRQIGSKTKRSYYEYSPGSVVDIQPTYQSITVWKPPVYQLSRPYYIPIFGYPGRIPIFYPPQPFVTQPVVPPEEVNRPFQGPTYLPPTVKPATVKPPPGSTTMPLDDRFNGDDEDDRPVWPNGGVSTPRPAGVVPTRRPGGPGRTQPPLVHNATGGGGQSGGGQSGGGQSGGGQSGGGFRPPQASFDQPPRRPPQVPQVPPTGPSSCVWAIISCCSTSGEIPYNCFDQRGCSGAFWDNNPCDSDFANAAIASALNYYDRNKR